MADQEKGDTFLYFGFGSNLLKERLKLNNPTAHYESTARLKDYVLDFDHWNNFWMGAAATIAESPGEEVWGTVWELNSKDRENLDRQEAVHLGIYHPLSVTVETPGGTFLHCLTYQMNRVNSEDRRPSPQYMEIIISGAVQSGLPEHYVNKLRAIEHNGYEGEVGVHKQVKEKQTSIKTEDS